MSFDSRTARKDDNPKSRVLTDFPKCICIKLNVRLFAIQNDGKFVCHAKNAYQAWLEAEFILKNR